MDPRHNTIDFYREIIASNLKFLRARAKRSQESMADLLLCGRSAYGSYEEGRASPPFQVLIRITEVYGITINDFVTKDLSKGKHKEDKAINETLAKWFYNKYLSCPDKIKEIINTLIELKC
jgi:transcriptional regulator with XRE-family HTH domain